jgi:uncharacterized protein YdcH (DUF465 family)
MKRKVILVSVLLNGLLLAIFALPPPMLPPAARKFFVHDSPGASGGAANFSVRPRDRVDSITAAPPPLAALLATEDLRTLIARLRAAGFPDRAIRAIIEAKLAERNNARLREIAPAPLDAYWKSRPLASGAQDEYERARLLAEQSRVTRELLGSIVPESDDDISPEQRRRYGNLSAAKIQQLERIAADYEEMKRALVAATGGISLPVDREKIAVLEREKRADLAALLTPEELEGYDMRQSPITRELRETLGALKVSEAEFRTIFQIYDGLSDRIKSPAGFDQRTPAEQSAWWAQSRIAIAERDAQLRATLGEERYAEFARASDREYRELVELAEQNKRPLEEANRIFALRDRVTKETARISADVSLTAVQKAEALESLDRSVRTQLASTFGQSAADDYAKIKYWVYMIGRQANGHRDDAEEMVRAQALGTPAAATPPR